jgi:hypothetical protein
MKAGPSLLTWTLPTSNTDGSALDPTTLAGVQLSIDGSAAVAVPVASATKFDMVGLAAYDALKPGSHTIALALVTKGGAVSDFTSPLSFPVGVVPMAATNLAVA